jgi:hypothetical protein
MSYELDQLRNSASNYLHRQQSDMNVIMHRIHVLETFMQRALPYIKAMELIDPPPKQTP